MQTLSESAKPKRSFRKGCLVALLSIVGLCLIAAAVSAWSNRSLPKETTAPKQLDPLDKIRLAEALHLKADLGDTLWPGFGSEPIPVSLHYDQVSFLVGYPGSPPAAWQAVSGDDFQGQVYYRKAETDQQNFAIQVGDTWVAGMATKTMTDLFLMQVYRDLLPPVIEQVFPYRLLIQPSETQIGGVIHEAFHVYQARLIPQRLEAAEEAHRLGEQYWAVDATMHTAWKEEANLLAKASSAKTDGEARLLTRQFLEQRQQRRQRANLASELVDYERWLEWEEGVAKYTEVKILQLAHEIPSYQPIPEIQADPDFKAYRNYQQRWSQENIQLKLQAGQEGETRFYQTGLAMAYLLDRLSPGWKTSAFSEGVFLEDLLQETVR